MNSNLEISNHLTDVRRNWLDSRGEVHAPGAGTVTEQVVSNLTQHREQLLGKIHSVF